MRTGAVGLVALSITLVSCATMPTPPTVGLPSAAPLPSSTTTTTTSQPPTTTTTTVATTTTAPPQPISLINGLEVDDPSLLTRRVLAVKIDNHPRARPQSGIQEADMVIELMVEGITRFISIWHESDSDYLGPVRSGRPTDATLLQALSEPTFAISGAQRWIYDIFDSHDIHMLGESHRGLFRISGRSAPHNLYADTGDLRSSADDIGYPDLTPPAPIWEFGPMSEFTPEATSVRIDFNGNIVSWSWDEDTGLWLRSASGSPSMWRSRTGETGRVGFPVLVALYVEQYRATPDGPGSPVPASRTVGSGKAFVFADGRASQGTWSRSSESSWFVLTDDHGEIIVVPPGRVWVSLVPDETGLTFDH